MKERIKIPKGNDAVFSLYLYAKAQGVYGHIGEELIKVDRKPIILSQVENLSVRLISLFSKQESILPVTIASNETIPNRLQVEFPKELQGEGEYDIIVDFDIPNPSISDKLLHRSTRIPFVCIIPNKNNLDGFSDNINIVIDVMPAIIGEKGEQGERGQDGINGTNGENGRDGRDGVDGRDGANGKSALELLNEENSTEHSSITEALKTLMPKGSSESNFNDDIANIKNTISTLFNAICTFNIKDDKRNTAIDALIDYIKNYNIVEIEKKREEGSIYWRPIIKIDPSFFIKKEEGLSYNEEELPYEEKYVPFVSLGWFESDEHIPIIPFHPLPIYPILIDAKLWINLSFKDINGTSKQISIEVLNDEAYVLDDIYRDFPEGTDPVAPFISKVNWVHDPNSDYIDDSDQTPVFVFKQKTINE